MSKHVLRIAVAGLVLATGFVPERAHSSPEETYGTAHPTLAHEVDPAGQWMVLCQVRKDTDGDGKVEAFFDRLHGNVLGDDVEPYLVLAPGVGMRIEDFVSSDRSGRWVAIIRGDRLILINTRTKKEWDLSKTGALTDDVDPVFGPHSAASFDAGGKRCLYLRKNKKRVTVVVRDLVTHKDVLIDPGPDLFHRAHIDPSGLWALVFVVDKDTDKNGTLERPTYPSSLVERRCRGSVGAYSTFGQRGDDATLRIAPTTGGTAVSIPGLIAPIHEDLLIRQSSGALALRKRNGDEFPIVAAPDAAVLYARSATTASFVLAYGTSKEDRPLWLHRGNRRIQLPTKGLIRRDDKRKIIYGQYWPHWSRATTPGVADLVAFRLIPTTRHVGAIHGNRALIRGTSDGDQLHILDLETKETWQLPGTMKCSWRMLQTGPALFETGRMIHLQDPDRSGTYEGDPLAVDSYGRLLIGGEEKHGLVLGPLRWVEVR